MLCCSAAPLFCCPAAWIPSFFVCQQPISSAGSLIPFPASLPSPPPLPSFLSLGNSIFVIFMKMQPFPFTSPAAQTHGRQIGLNLWPQSLASSTGLLQRRCPLLPAGTPLPGRLFQGPVTICDAPPYWLRPRPVAWIARSPGLDPGRLQTLHSRRI